MHNSQPACDYVPHRSATLYPVIPLLRLEVHVFDFDAEIYGHHVTVEFVHRIRAEQRFASLDELRAQISADSRAARISFGLSEANG
jgi:hypothetical protein